MQIDAVKIIQGATELVFSEFEAPRIEEIILQDVTVTQFSVGGHRYRSFPERKKMYRLTINRRNKGVAAKVNTLLAMVGELELYPCLNYDAALAVDVIRLIDQRTTFIRWGEEPLALETLTFQEI